LNIPEILRTLTLIRVRIARNNICPPEYAAPKTGGNHGDQSSLSYLELANSTTEPGRKENTHT
jgi:hypothetical protein